MNNSIKKRAVVYCRVSTDKKEQETSINNQRNELRRICDYRNWTIPKINEKSVYRKELIDVCIDGVYFDIGTSGTKLTRPAFDKLLHDAGLKHRTYSDTGEESTEYTVEKEPRFDYIVVKDASRFARNTNVGKILEVLKNNNVFVYFRDLDKSTEDEDNWTYIKQFLLFAEDESRRKRRSVTFGYEAGIKAGKIYVGGKIFGYDYDKENNRLIINEDEAKVVRRVFDLYTEEGLGQYRICYQLEKEGHKNSAGKVYKRSTIKRMLQNEKYCGITTSGRYHKTDLFSNKKVERDYNDELRKQARQAQQNDIKNGIVRIPPIISKEQFEKAQKITAKNSETYKVSKEWHGTTDYAKKIVCGTCGAYYRASGRKAYVKYGNKKIARYVCKHSIVYNNNEKCKNPSILEPELDAALYSIDCYRSLSRALDLTINTFNKSLDKEKRRIDSDKEARKIEILNQLDKATIEKNKLARLYISGKYNDDELEEFSTEINGRIEKLKDELDCVSESNDEIQERIERLNAVCQSFKDGKAIIDEMIDEDNPPKLPRKEILKTVSRIYIMSDGHPHVSFDSNCFIDYDSLKSTLVKLSKKKKKQK